MAYLLISQVWSLKTLSTFYLIPKGKSISKHMDKEDNEDTQGITEYLARVTTIPGLPFLYLYPGFPSHSRTA